MSTSPFNPKAHSEGPSPQQMMRARKAHKERGSNLAGKNSKKNKQGKVTRVIEGEDGSITTINWRPQRSFLDDLMGEVDGKTPPPPTPEEIELMKFHPSVSVLPPEIFTKDPLGPLYSGLPVGTYFPDDVLAGPECSNEEKMHYRRVVFVNFDDNGNIRWNAVDLNIHGEVPRDGPNSIPRLSSVSIKLTNLVHFFHEYMKEFNTWSKTGDYLYNRKEKIYNQMNEIWNMEWATSWSSGLQMLNDNGSREQWIRRTKRIANDGYEIPFFTEDQMGDNPKDARMSLLNRMDGAQFRFIDAIAKSNEKALEEGSVGSIQHIQERAYHFKRTVDFMNLVHDQMNCLYGNLMFGVKDAQYLHQTGRDQEEKLQGIISKRLLEGETRTSQKLGKSILPVLRTEVEKDGTERTIVTFSLNEETVPQEILLGLEEVQLIRPQGEIGARKLHCERLSRRLGLEVGPALTGAVTGAGSG